MTLNRKDLRWNDEAAVSAMPQAVGSIHLYITPGYTIFMVDTNILLSSLRSATISSRSHSRPPWTVPASLRNIPMWTYGFHNLLESLCRASFTSPLALEHLQDVIYYAYSFYTGLFEELNLSSFRMTG